MTDPVETPTKEPPPLYGEGEFMDRGFGNTGLSGFEMLARWIAPTHFFIWPLWRKLCYVAAVLSGLVALDIGIGWIRSLL